MFYAHRYLFMQSYTNAYLSILFDLLVRLSKKWMFLYYLFFSRSFFLFISGDTHRYLYGEYRYRFEHSLGPCRLHLYYFISRHVAAHPAPDGDRREGGQKAEKFRNGNSGPRIYGNKRVYAVTRAKTKNGNERAGGRDSRETQRGMKASGSSGIFAPHTQNIN